MYPEDFDDYFYEPSEGELFFDEMKEKFMGILKEDVNSELNKLRSENAKLRKIVEEYENVKSELSIKKSSLEWKIKNVRNEVERDFYNKAIEEVFEQLLEDEEVWYAEKVPHEKPKCKLCNEERNLIAIFPDGETKTKKCECSKPTYVYEPVTSINREIKFHKSYKKSGSNKRLYFVKSYQPNKNYADAYDCYAEFKINTIYDDFTEEVKEYHKIKSYGEKIAFRSQAACQKYCDWLNNECKYKT